jgi:TatD DNase family protein
MYSDTHFHFKLITQNADYDGSSLFETMAGQNVRFAQDIGTQCDDLPQRQKSVQQALSGIGRQELRKVAENFIYFSAGIWPSSEAVTARFAQISILERQIRSAMLSDVPLFHKISALGECGLDHHWNPSGVDGRSSSDFTAAVMEGERELFCMQLKLAQCLDLPVIVHSRDAFEDTLECISDTGYDRGVIHCYSYGIEEARAFLDRGWYISFSGSVTYTKKNRIDAMEELLRYIPDDKILVETDAPYLAPVPLRGSANSPTYIEHTYNYIAAARNISAEELSDIVDANSRKLFIR